MRRVWAIARKEALHIRRDMRSLAVSILMPLLMIVLYGYALNIELRNLPLAVLDLDHTGESRDLVCRMTSSGFIVNAGALDHREEIERGFRRSEFRSALVIPKGYAEALQHEMAANVQIILDGADGASASAAENYLAAVIAGINRDMASRIPGSPGTPIDLRPRVLFNPQLESVNFIVPGLVAIVLMMVCAMLTSIAIARERETGTMEQILTTPIAPWQVMTGKVLPYLVIGSFDAAMVLAVGRWVFGVPMVGSWLALAGYCFLFLTIGLSLGLLISTLVATQQVATVLAMMLTMLPTILLSGFIFDVRSMPVVLRYISQVIPATHFLKIIRGVMMKGDNWFPLEGGVLLLMAVLILHLATRRFKERLE